MWLIMSQFRGPRRVCYLIKAYGDTIIKNTELSPKFGFADIRLKKKKNQSDDQHQVTIP